MGDKYEQTQQGQTYSMETEIYNALDEANKRIKEIIAENKCESPKTKCQSFMGMLLGESVDNLLTQRDELTLKCESLSKELGKEHTDLINETKSHAEDNKRHLEMIDRLKTSLELLSGKLNKFMEEISKGEILQGQAKGFVGEWVIWTLREEYDKAIKLIEECEMKYGDLRKAVE